MVNTGVVARRIRVYFGFSRMSHSVLDIGHPGFGALLVLGAFPPFPVLLLGVLAAFAGFTAVFALNDLIDFRVDTERIEKYQREFTDFDLDVLGLRHPIAQKALSFTQGLIWVLFWGMLSLGIAFRLNPVCCLILIAAIGLEISLLRPPQSDPLEDPALRGHGGDRGPCGCFRRRERAALGVCAPSLYLVFRMGGRRPEYPQRLDRPGGRHPSGDKDPPGPLRQIRGGGRLLSPALPHGPRQPFPSHSRPPARTWCSTRPVRSRPAASSL